MKKRDNKQLKKNGYIALTTVLVIIPLLLATGIDLAYRSITNALVSKLEFDHNMLEVNAESCLEESVRKIKLIDKTTHRSFRSCWSVGSKLSAET